MAMPNSIAVIRELYCSLEGSDDDEADELTAKADELATKADELTTKSDELATKADELTAKSDELTAKSDELATKADELVTKAEELTAKSDELTAESDELTPKADELTAEILIIQSTHFGSLTQRWIRLGNFLHKTSLLGGLAAIVTSLASPEHTCVYGPMLGIALSAAGVYAVFWQGDPCCKYQVVPNLKIQRMVKKISSGRASLVLVRTDNLRRRWLHTAVVAAAVGVVGWMWYTGEDL